MYIKLYINYWNSKMYLELVSKKYNNNNDTTESRRMSWSGQK